MKRKTKRLGRLIALALGGIPLITTATCDPYTGTFDLYRDDDFHHHSFFDGYYYEEYVVYDDCFFSCWW